MSFRVGAALKKKRTSVSSFIHQRIFIHHSPALFSAPRAAGKKRPPWGCPGPRRGSHHRACVQLGPGFPQKLQPQQASRGQQGPPGIRALPRPTSSFFSGPSLLHPQGGLAAELRVPHVLRAAPRGRPAARAAGQEGGERGPVLRGEYCLCLLKLGRWHLVTPAQRPGCQGQWPQPSPSQRREMVEFAWEAVTPIHRHHP